MSTDRFLLYELVAVLSAPGQARSDITTQLYGNSAITKPPTPTSLNSALTALVDTVENFTQFENNLQRALLESSKSTQTFHQNEALKLSKPLPDSGRYALAIGSEAFDENKVVIKMSIVMTVVMGPRVLWRYRRSTAVRSGRSKREELEIYKNEGELNAFADYRTMTSDGKEDASFLYVR
ncbi:hypothetical protein GN958_ATG12310 [Phytophthora infestans]|uniref:Uncharacterized protein n=2 Tax=Phytophthora infestans TaxID=4787 RepID=A0A8S9UHP7_PHYIN|nr:hypothetical protein GN958_ATG12310 [Phytophthora infestans]